MFLGHYIQYIVRRILTMFDRVHSCLGRRPGFQIIDRVRGDFLAGAVRFLYNGSHFLRRNRMTRDHLDAVRSSVHRLLHRLLHRLARLVGRADDRIFLLDDVLTIRWDTL